MIKELRTFNWIDDNPEIEAELLLQELAGDPSDKRYEEGLSQVFEDMMQDCLNLHYIYTEKFTDCYTQEDFNRINAEYRKALKRTLDNYDNMI